MATAVNALGLLLQGSYGHARVFLSPPGDTLISELQSGGGVVMDIEKIVQLESGLSVDIGDAVNRFFAEEWAYYDGLADVEPMRVLPVDVLATVAMNSFVNDAAKVRSVHRGLAEVCDPILPLIPVDADLLAFDPDLELARELFDVACNARGVLMAVATKVLHRKRRSFIPMLDGVVIDAYLAAMDKSSLRSKTQDGRTAGGVGVTVLEAFRNDLVGSMDRLVERAAQLESAGTPVTPLRLLEVAVWMAVEPNGYYRNL